MLFENILLPGVLVPAFAAGLALLIALGADRRRRDSTVGGASLAVGLAFTTAYVALTGFPRWPPVESTQRLFFLVVLATIVGLAWGWRREQSPPWLVRAALLALLLSLVLRSLIGRWSAGTSALRLAVLFALGAALLWALERSLATERSTGLLPAALRLAVLGGAALALGLSGTARLGQLLGALACGVFVVEVVARRRRRRPWLAGDAVVLSIAVFGLLLGGFFYASLGVWPAILLMAALLTLGAVAGASGFARWLPLAPLLLALGLVAYALANQEDDPYGYYGSTSMRGSLGSETYSTSVTASNLVEAAEMETSSRLVRRLRWRNDDGDFHALVDSADRQLAVGFAGVGALPVCLVAAAAVSAGRCRLRRCLRCPASAADPARASAAWPPAGLRLQP